MDQSPTRTQDANEAAGLHGSSVGASAVRMNEMGADGDGHADTYTFLTNLRDEKTKLPDDQCAILALRHLVDKIDTQFETVL